MYDYINGEFVYKISNSKGCFATIESSGIGYSFEIMPRDYNLLIEENAKMKLYTVLIHKEDKMSLCGFLKREDRDMFNVLISVSGVGVKMALTLLDSFLITDLVGFVLDGNYKALTNAKGVGPKLAQKIILELKDKLNSYKNENLSDCAGNNNLNNLYTPEIEDAQSVLKSLGYENKEIKSAINRALESLSDNSSAEEILKKSLQILSV